MGQAGREELRPKIIGHFTVGDPEFSEALQFEVLFYKYCLVFHQIAVITESWLLACPSTLTFARAAAFPALSTFSNFISSHPHHPAL